MNVEQGKYQLSRILNGYPDLILTPAVLHTFYTTMVTESAAFAAANGLVGLIAGFFAVLACKSRIQLHIKRKKAKKNKYPFNDNDEIVFDDKMGLEMLLERTSEKKLTEWGTCLNAHDDEERTVIDSILTPEETESRGLIKSIAVIKTTVLHENRKKIRSGGFNGIQHYHPMRGAPNFTISIIDRNLEPEWINLLTFNMPYGPEVIGYNLFHTYIPKERANELEAKLHLVKATPKQIRAYLAQ